MEQTSDLIYKGKLIEENMKGVDTFVTLSAGGYVETKAEKADALDLAEQKLVDLMQGFDYQNKYKIIDAFLD